MTYTVIRRLPTTLQSRGVRNSPGRSGSLALAAQGSAPLRPTSVARLPTHSKGQGSLLSMLRRRHTRIDHQALYAVRCNGAWVSP